VLLDWVEHGIVPDRVIASKVVGGVLASARSLCPYPASSRHRWVGDTTKAESFACVDDGGELDQHPVTGGLDDPPAMHGDPGIDQLAAICFEARKGAFLVGADQARTAGNIGGENRREPTFDTSLPAGFMAPPGGKKSYANPRPMPITPEAFRSAPSSRQDPSVSMRERLESFGPGSAARSRLFPGYGDFSRFSGPKIPGYLSGDERSGCLQVFDPATLSAA